MENFEVPYQSVVDEIVAQNKEFALTAATMRAALASIRKEIEILSQEVNQPLQTAYTDSEVQQ